MQEPKYKIIGANPFAEKINVMFHSDGKCPESIAEYVPCAQLSGGGILQLEAWVGAGKDREQAQAIADSMIEMSVPKVMTLCQYHSLQYAQQRADHKLKSPPNDRCDICGGDGHLECDARPVPCKCGSNLVTVIREDNRYFFVQCLECGHCGGKGHSELRAVVLWLRERFGEDKLPTFDECARAIQANCATALHTFIYGNEPAGKEESRKFRDELLAMITEAGNSDPSRISDDLSSPTVGFDLAENGGDTTSVTMVSPREMRQVSECRDCRVDILSIFTMNTLDLLLGLPFVHIFVISPRKDRLSQFRHDVVLRKFPGTASHWFPAVDFIAADADFYDFTVHSGVKNLVFIVDNIQPLPMNAETAIQYAKQEYARNVQESSANIDLAKKGGDNPSYFEVKLDTKLDASELQFQDSRGTVLGRIVNIGEQVEDKDGRQLNVCKCGSKAEILPFGKRLVRVVCPNCKTAGIPDFTLEGAIRQWNHPSATAEIHWFPVGCEVYFRRDFEGKYCIGYSMNETRKSFASWCPFDYEEAIHACYVVFIDDHLDNHPDLLVPWMRPNADGDLPGGVCCERAESRWCEDHDMYRYHENDSGEWVKRAER